MLDLHHLGGGVPAIEVGQVHRPEATLTQQVVGQTELIFGYLELIKESTSSLTPSLDVGFLGSQILRRTRRQCQSSGTSRASEVPVSYSI